MRFSREEKLVGSTARLAFYDWEASSLTPNGKVVADQLQAQDPTAETISQGGAGGVPGDAGVGSMNLYDAVKLASKLPPQIASDNSRKGSAYYAFGAPGSTACTATAKFYGTTVSAGRHCYLAGPDDKRADLVSGLPPGVSAAPAEILSAPEGIVVLQAADVSSKNQTQPYGPNAQFYVLKDHVSLFGNDITNPHQSTDQSGQPDVSFRFTSKGVKAFQDVTAQIAKRGELDSLGSLQLNQHFALALDNKLITVPQIDYKQYPDGITGGQGADITGGFSTQSAQDLATQLRLGALPVTLELVSERRIAPGNG